METTNCMSEYRTMEEMVTKMITSKNEELLKSKKTNRMTYGEPEEASYKKRKPMTEEEYILSELDKANKKLRRSVVYTITYMNNKMADMGIVYDEQDLVWKWFLNHTLERIFEVDNDAEWYLHYVIWVCKILVKHPDMFEKQKAVYKNGKLVYKPVTMKQYMVDTFQLDKNNPIHGKFIQIINKVADYYQNTL